MKNVLVEGTKSKFQVLAQKPANVLKRIKGVLSDFGTNRNGRIYPRELWENVINSDYVREMINSHGLVGELDHPEERLEISLQEVSHVINDMWIEGDKVMGIIDILPTPNGKIINELLDYGTDIGISSRGAGSVGPDNVVDPDYQFITFDFVARPSCEAARLNTILEGVKIDLENNSADKVNAVLESYKEELKEDIKDDFYKNKNRSHKYFSFKDMAEDKGKEIVRYNQLLNTDTGIQSTFNFSSVNGGAPDSFQYYNDYVVIDKRKKDAKKEAVSTQQEKFINYCKDKIQDLGTTFVEYYDRKVNVKVAFTQEIRDYGMCKILEPNDCYELLDIEGDSIAFVKENGEFIATPMTTADILVARLEFNAIDKSFYEDTLKYWEDLNMDENLSETVKVTRTTYKLDPAYKLTEAMSDQEVYKVVLNWYKDQIEAGKMTLNQCYELLSDKAKVSLNKLVDQSKIRESIMTKEVSKILKEAKLNEESDEFKPNGIVDDLKKPKYDVDLEVESPLELNTGILPILDTDTYSRDEMIYDNLLSGYGEGEEPTDEEEKEYYKELDRLMVAYGAPIVEEYIKEVLPSAKVEGLKIYHPRQYNFTTDELEFKVSFDPSEYNTLESKTVENPEFAKYIKENYGDRSGFISYLADNIDEFYQQDGWERFVQVVMFNLGDKEDEFYNTNERYWDDILSNC